MTDIEKIVVLEDLIESESIDSYKNLCVRLRHKHFPGSEHYNFNDLHAIVVRYSNHFQALFD